MKTNQNIYLISIIILLGLGGCSQKKPLTDNIKFKIPFIVQDPTSDTIDYFKSDSITECNAVFLGKFSFSDTIKLPYDIDSYIDKRDTNYYKDVIIDYSSKKLSFDNKYSSDGLQVFTDYKTSVSYNQLWSKAEKRRKYYYPVYIVNETSNSKIFIAKQDWAYALQEALDSNNNKWSPIEYPHIGWCGSNYFGMKIHHNEFVVILMPKYQGCNNTLLRVRIKIGEITYVSKPYIGSFNYSQFEIKRSFPFYKEINKSRINAIQDIFYGSVPKEFIENF